MVITNINQYWLNVINSEVELIYIIKIIFVDRFKIKIYIFVFIILYSIY